MALDGVLFIPPRKWFKKRLKLKTVCFYWTVAAGTKATKYDCIDNADNALNNSGGLHLP